MAVLGIECLYTTKRYDNPIVKIIWLKGNLTK
jgi:hypothetical protein